MKDDAVTEILLMHCPLADVLAFAIAREDVREMCHEVVRVDAPPESAAADTMPLPTVRTPTIIPGAR